MFTIRTWSRRVGVAAAEQCTFDEERLHTDRYIQRLDVTAHTHTHREKYIYKCMYISEMPHWGRNVAALYIHTHTNKYTYFHHLEDAFKGGWWVGQPAELEQGGHAREGGGGEGGLCSAFTLKALSFQPVFPHKYVCVYPKAWNYWFSFLFNLKLTSSDATL